MGVELPRKKRSWQQCYSQSADKDFWGNQVRKVARESPVSVTTLSENVQSTLTSTGAEKP